MPLPSSSEATKPAKAPCPSCAAGPAGIEGHEHLRVKALGNVAVRFECRECGLRWSRSDAPGGGFAWASVDAEAPLNRSYSAGVPLPSR